VCGLHTIQLFSRCYLCSMRWPSGKQFALLIPAALLLGFFFIMLGQPDSLSVLFTTRWFYFDFLFVSIISFIVLFYITTAHNTLDNRFPLRDSILQRLLWQAVWGLVFPVMLSFGLTFAYMHFVLHQDIRTTLFFVYEFPISIVVILCINLVLIVASLWFVPKQESEVLLPSTILASQGNRTVPLPIRSIAIFSKEGDYYLITTFDSQQYISPHHLDELELMVSSRDFFRANRQTLIHRDACGHFTTDRSGKITLYLSTKSDLPLSISQKRGADFRAWLAQ